MKNKQNSLVYLLMLAGIFSVFTNSCKKDDINTNTFTDSRDGTVYKTVKIGNQVWMAENLRYLPNVAGSGIGSASMSYCYVNGYDGTDITAAKATSNYKTYGVLYNWTAAVNACPSGWHLPTDAEWTQMENYLVDNGFNYDGTTGGGRDKLAKSLANSNGWTSSSEVGAVGNTDYSAYRNKSGFTALPGGNRYANGLFSNIGFDGYWWSATESDTGSASGRKMYYDFSGVDRGNELKALGLSVRCVKD